MLTEHRLKLFLDLVNSSTHDELIWLNNHLTGIISKNNITVPSKQLISKLTILYGTETGNSKKLATDFAAKAKKNGCLLYTSPSPRDRTRSRMPSSA